MDYKARIKFKEKEWLVIEVFKYDGIKYMYIAEDVKLSEPIMTKDLENIEIKFIKATTENRYIEVEDPEQIQKLTTEVIEKMIEEETETENQ